jgi:uncharacterized protein (DUF58 family)
LSTYETLRAVTRFSTILVLTVFCAVLGFAYANGVLIALFEALVAVMGLSYLYVRLASRSLYAIRAFAPRAYEEEEVRVSLTIANRFGLPLFLVEVRDWFACDALPEKRLIAQRIPAGGAVRIEYGGLCAHGRGRFDIGPLEIAVSDPLGLFRYARTFGQLSELVVYPRTFEVRDLGLQELQWRAPVSVSTDRTGHASTFYGTREYRPGDNIRRIHWPSTLRWGRWILKEFEQDTNLEVTCFLDLNRATLRGVGRGSNIEHAVRIAASIAGHVTSRLCSFQLIADPGSPLVLPARPGKSQLVAALDALARVKPTGRRPYLELVSSAMRLVGEGSGIVLIFNTLDVDPTAMFSVLAEVMKKRARIVPIALDDATFLPLESSGPRRSESEARLERLKESMAGFGMEPVVVRSGDDLAEVFANPVSPAGVHKPELSLEDELRLVESA